MSEDKVFFQSGEVKIEGLLEEMSGSRGVVVTHPHPLYGGEMRNNVVEAVTQAYREKGYTTLRFNFRGVGGSEGSFDNGDGEQEDVKAALSYLSGLGMAHIDLAGYSFGAWVNALGIDRFDLAERLIMVSPPVNFISFDFLKNNPKIKLVVVGTGDEIAGAHMVERDAPKWNPEAVFRKIQGADHFYWGYLEELKGIIREFLTESDSSEPG